MARALDFRRRELSTGSPIRILIAKEQRIGPHGALRQSEDVAEKDRLVADIAGYRRRNERSDKRSCNWQCWNVSHQFSLLGQIIGSQISWRRGFDNFIYNVNHYLIDASGFLTLPLHACIGRRSPTRRRSRS